MADARILVVESDGTGRESLVQELERREFVVRAALCGAGAMEAFQAESFDLVLLLATRQSFEWMGLLKGVMRYDPEALVVVLSTEATVDMAVDALKSGATEFIEGPLCSEDVAARLREILAHRGERAVQGNLRDLALTSIISVNCNEHNQAELVIRRQGRVGIIYFDGGRIVHAILDGQEGEGAIYELLSWEDGSFSLRQNTPAPKRTIQAEWTGLILEGMRRIDDGVDQLGLDGLEDTVGEEAPAMELLAEGLKEIEGVESVVVCSAGGQLFGEKASPDPDRSALFTALVAQRSRRLAFALDAGQPKGVLITRGRGRFLVVPFGEDCVGVWLSQRCYPEVTTSEVGKVLRRYRELKGVQQ
jgi:FixJ family two-component response regulator/predicted regulator of Ras-like GTPase activity (Roadblock/LC7/MglB family)